MTLQENDELLYAEIVSAIKAWFVPGAEASEEAIEAMTRWYHTARRDREASQ